MADVFGNVNVKYSPCKSVAQLKSAADYIKGISAEKVSVNLKTDGKVHLRIDYKVSGIGSNSCGPTLDPKYQVNDKKIYFCFSVCF